MSGFSVIARPAEALASLILRIHSHFLSSPPPIPMGHPKAHTMPLTPHPDAADPGIPAVNPPVAPPVTPTLLYLCRQCGSRFTGYPLLSGTGMFDAIVRTYGQLSPLPGDPVKLPLCVVHDCGGGVDGIADVTGVRVGTTG